MRNGARSYGEHAPLSSLAEDDPRLCVSGKEEMVGSGHRIVRVLLVPAGDQLVAGFANVVSVLDLALEFAGGVDAIGDMGVGPVTGFDGSHLGVLGVKVDSRLDAAIKIV